MMHIQIVNPNTSHATTDLMVEMARRSVTADTRVTGVTARSGARLIIEPAALATAAEAVLELRDLMIADAVIVAAFGDPGADRLREYLPVPIIGIGEAAIRAAAQSQRRFSIATTTPLLVPEIERRVKTLGFAAQLAGIHVTTQDPNVLTSDPFALEVALADLVERCVAIDGADAVVIGGGPLARAAQALSMRSPVPIIEPVPEAVKWVMRMLSAQP